MIPNMESMIYSCQPYLNPISIRFLIRQEQNWLKGIKMAKSSSPPFSSKRIIATKIHNMYEKQISSLQFEAPARWTAKTHRRPEVREMPRFLLLSQWEVSSRVK